MISAANRVGAPRDAELAGADVEVAAGRQRELTRRQVDVGGDIQGLATQLELCARATRRLRRRRGRSSASIQQLQRALNGPLAACLRAASRGGRHAAGVGRDIASRRDVAGALEQHAAGSVELGLRRQPGLLAGADLQAVRACQRERAGAAAVSAAGAGTVGQYQGLGADANLIGGRGGAQGRGIQGQLAQRRLAGTVAAKVRGTDEVDAGIAAQQQIGSRAELAEQRATEQQAVAGLRLGATQLQARHANAHRRGAESSVGGQRGAARGVQLHPATCRLQCGAVTQHQVAGGQRGALAQQLRVAARAQQHGGAVAAQGPCRGGSGCIGAGLQGGVRADVEGFTCGEQQARRAQALAGFGIDADAAGPHIQAARLLQVGGQGAQHEVFGAQGGELLGVQLQAGTGRARADMDHVGAEIGAATAAGLAGG